MAMASGKRSIPVTSIPLSASQTESTPAPQPTSSARPRPAQASTAESKILLGVSRCQGNRSARAQWKELARHPDRIEIVLERMLTHFLEHPDPNGFKAQLVAVDRKACALYKKALDKKLAAQRGHTYDQLHKVITALARLGTTGMAGGSHGPTR